MNARNLNILYEDNHIIVYNKPHGLATQSRRAGVLDVESLLLNHLSASGGANSASASGVPYLAVIHRLDQPVAGILVFAKTPAAARELNRQLQQKKFEKYYRAEAEGRMPAAQGILEDYLIRDGRLNISRVCSKDTPGSRLARLHYRVLREEACGGTPRSHLEIRLDTGRHHQIRVQLAHAGCPLVGDTKYNPSASSSGERTELKLCAYKLSFRHPASKEWLEFEI